MHSYLPPRSQKGAVRTYVKNLMRLKTGNKYRQLDQKTVRLIGWVFAGIERGTHDDLRDLQVTLEECLAFVRQAQNQVGMLTV